MVADCVADAAVRGGRDVRPAASLRSSSPAPVGIHGGPTTSCLRSGRAVAATVLPPALSFETAEGRIQTTCDLRFPTSTAA